MEGLARLDRLRVMVVEDNAHMMLIVKTILRGFGVKEFTDARDIEEAWDRLNADPVNVMIVDRVLGRQDGLDLVRQIRGMRIGPIAYLPIIMLSAHTERQRIEEARDAGATEFCCKPVTARDLYTKVARVIDNPRSFGRTSSCCGPDRRRTSKA